MAASKAKKSTVRKKVSPAVRRPTVRRTSRHASWAFFAPVKQFLQILWMVFFPFATTDKPQVRHEGQTKKSTPLSRKKTTPPSLSTTKRTETKKPPRPLFLRRIRG